MGQKESVRDSNVTIEINGWNFLELEGNPIEIGYKHGYLLAEKIRRTIDDIVLWSTVHMKRPWSFFRETAEKFYISKIPEEQRMELEGIVKGVQDRNVDLDYVDIVALNGHLDTITYHHWLKSRRSEKTFSKPHGCSAFAATGSATRDHKIVFAHNSWWAYLTGHDWNVFINLKNEMGHRIQMQSMPGLIWSGTDWYINSTGLMVCETTYAGARRYDPNGIPIFVRCRKAIQYSNSIDEWTEIMIRKNNGGYAADWLIGDAKTGEIARLELGLSKSNVQKTKDGVFVGCNLALTPDVREETEFDYADPNANEAARFVRWNQLMNNHKGEIDMELAKRFLGDHVDTTYGREMPSSSTLCGHVDLDKRGIPQASWGPYYPGGCLDGKVTTSHLAEQGITWAHWGKPCNTKFDARLFLDAHPEYDWQSPLLSDIEPQPWTRFTVNFHRTTTQH